MELLNKPAKSYRQKIWKKKSFQPADLFCHIYTFSNSRCSWNKYFDEEMKYFAWTKLPKLVFDNNFCENSMQKVRL